MSENNLSIYEEKYAGIPPWEIGRPQKEVAKLASNGEVKGKVLDIGCGTGENSLYLASIGFGVVGADFSKGAIEKAKAKQTERNLKSNPKFVRSDALELSKELVEESPFDTILDCGLYHSLDEGDTDSYVANTHRLLKSNGTCFVLCFSDKQPGDRPGPGHPRRISKIELEEKFAKGWSINYIKEARLENNDPSLAEGAIGWLASISKTH